MRDGEINPLSWGCSVLNKTNSVRLSITVAEVYVGPNSFNVAVGNCFEDIGVFRLIIHRDESIPFLPKPEAKNSISKSNITVGLISRQPRNEVPGLVFA
jgi:hypothetical protein